MKAKFIVFEGIDASGKGTISKMLAEHLQAKLFSFPNYSTPIGELIREYLQKKWWTVGLYQESPKHPPVTQFNQERDALVFQALQAANRLEFVQEIQDYLEDGYTVICDRYIVSGEVYGAADGLSPAYLERLFSFLPQPDITFLLDIPVEESFRRRPDRNGDRYEEDKAKLEDIRQRYLKLFQRRAYTNPRKWHIYNNSWKWQIIDGTQSPQEILKKILDIIQ